MLVVGVVLPRHSAGFYFGVNAVGNAYHRQTVILAYLGHVLLAGVAAVKDGEKEHYRDVLVLGEERAHQALVSVFVVAFLTVVYSKLNENNV